MGTNNFLFCPQYSEFAGWISTTLYQDSAVAFVKMHQKGLQNASKLIYPRIEHILKTEIKSTFSNKAFDNWFLKLIQNLQIF